MKPSTPCFHCTSCPTSYFTRKELIAHKIRANHVSIHIVCAWCVAGPPRDFRWAQDLRRHVRQAHPAEHEQQPSKVLSTGTCFFYCREALNYLNLFEVTPADNSEATYAKSQMVRWCSAHQEDLEKWHEGWKQAPSSLTSNSSSSTSCPPPSSSSSSTGCLPQSSLPEQQTPSHHSETSCTKRMLSSSLNLESISLSPADLKAYFTDSNSSIYLVKMSADIFHDAKSLSSLTRKMCTLNSNFCNPHTSWQLVSDSRQLREDVSRSLGIDSKFISTLLMQPYQPFKLMKTSTITSEESQPTEGEIVPIQPQPHTPAATTTILSPPHISDIFSYSDGESLGSPSSISLSGGDSPTYNPNSPSYDPTSHQYVSSLSPSYNVNSPKFTAKPHGVETTQPLVDESTNEQTLAVNSLTTPLIPYKPENPSISPEISQQNNSPPASQPTVTYTPTPVTSTQQRATDLLRNGSLPLLPPAPREWASVPEESIPISPSLLWPPKNWQTLSPDQKTLASEFAAMTVFHHATGEFKVIDRQQVLHQYNFIVLPGSKGTKQTTLTRVQHLNFLLVKSIANGKVTLPNDLQENILNSFKKTEPSPILLKLSHVPLRLGKSSN